jgi:hypothetical protein
VLAEVSEWSVAFRQVCFLAVLVHKPTQHQVMSCMSRPVLRGSSHNLRDKHHALHEAMVLGAARHAPSPAPMDVCAELVASVSDGALATSPASSALYDGTTSDISSELGSLDEAAGNAQPSKRAKQQHELSGLFVGEDEASASGFTS